MVRLVIRKKRRKYFTGTVYRGSSNRKPK